MPGPGPGRSDVMVTATVLALAAAVLHAGWNLLAKQSSAPFVALWAQFAIAGLIGAVVAIGGGLPAAGWGYAALSGLIHVPYLAGLARAYEHGDFSLAYPLARGGGALLAGVGGIVLLGDDLDGWSVVAIVAVVAGIALLAVGAPVDQVAPALFVAVTIGAYTVVDSWGARELGGVLYPFASFAATGAILSVHGVATGRATALLALRPAAWRTAVVTAVMAIVTYTLVLLAVQRAPVGYVAALRESSVVLAAFIGTRYLSETGTRRRTIAASIVLAGLVLLVVSVRRP